MSRGTGKAIALLAIVLNVLFFPALWGNRTLLDSARDAPSIVRSGAFHQDMPSSISRTPDPGAPAWQTEPWFKIISQQYWQEHILPLWNPYAAYGKPLAAVQQAQPFYPLTLLLSLHVSPRTYDFFVVGRLFVAGVLMFFFARCFLEPLPSLVAAISYMLCGYFIAMLDMPHVSVEVVTPGILLTFERVLCRNSWGSVTLAAVAIFVAVLGGMPESLFLAVCFGCVYFLFRLGAEQEFRRHLIGSLAKFVAALVLGFGLAAISLVPFVELVRVAHDTHQLSNVSRVPGLYADTYWPILALYLLPLLFGPVGNSIFSNFSGWTGLWGYWGVVPCLFATTAALRAVMRPDPLYSKTWRRLTVFFAVCLALLILKRFGSPVINWVGGLPLADMVVFTKYDEPLMALCVAALAGIGFAVVVERRARAYYFPLAAIVLTLVMLGLAGLSLPLVLTLTAHRFVYYTVLLAGLLVVTAAVSWFALTSRPALARWRTPGFLALLIAELSSNFIIPSFYFYNGLPSAASNPYSGAPYIDFLRAQDLDHSRIFARDWLLYPNWAGVFGLADVRSLDAIEYRPFYDFVRYFLLKPGDEKGLNNELDDRFTGVDYDYDFTSDTAKRFLFLSSVKYFISTSEYGVSDAIAKQVVAQHQGEKIWGFGLDTFPIRGGHEAIGVFEHPPSQRISYKTTIPPEEPVLTGTLAMKAAAQDRSDGAGFTLEIKSGDQIETLFHTDLDPRDVVADRAGHPFRVDLSRYAGQNVELLFSTDPGPSGNNAFDWVGWARMAFQPLDGLADPAAQAFKEIYDHEVYIYEVAGVLPRAALYSAAEVLPEDEVLARLKAPGFDPAQKVILGRDSISPTDEAAIGSFTAAAGSPVRAARIVSYQPEHVRIEAETDAPALLMLNDSDYPGWRASVNGQEVSILRADYLFRGVIVPAGKSVVEFDYEPRSFRIGAGISGGSLVLLTVLPLASWRRRRRVSEPPG